MAPQNIKGQDCWRGGEEECPYSGTDALGKYPRVPKKSEAHKVIGGDSGPLAAQQPS